MASAATTKTWQIFPNLVTPGTSRGSLLRTIKNVLCGITAWPSTLLNPWTVVSSSNGTVAGVGDNWASDADANTGVSSTGARSWIVLQNASGMQILIDYVTGGNADTAQFRMSPRGLFIGGTTTARPTATDEIPETGAPAVLGSNPYQKQFTLFATAKLLHFWHSADGLQTMIVGYQSTTGSPDFGSLEVFWILGQAEQPHPAWPHPHVLFIGTAGNATNPDNMFNSNDWVIAEDTPGKYQLLSPVLEGQFDGSFWHPVASSGKNQISNTYPIEPFTLWSGKYKCKIGRWPVDVFATATDAAGFTTGDFHPGDGSKKFVKVNGLLIPWDGVSSWSFPT